MTNKLIEEIKSAVLADAGETPASILAKKQHYANVATLPGAHSSELSSSAALKSDNRLISKRLSDLRAADEMISSLVIKKMSLDQQLDALNREIALTTSRRDALRVECAAASNHISEDMSQYSIAKDQADRVDELESMTDSIRDALLSLSSLTNEFMHVPHVESKISSSQSAELIPQEDEASHMSHEELLAATAERRKLDIEAFDSCVECDVACLDALSDRMTRTRNSISTKRRETAEYARLGIQVMLAASHNRCILLLLLNPVAH